MLTGFPVYIQLKTIQPLNTGVKFDGNPLFAHRVYCIFCFNVAKVAELVDALDLGSSGVTPVGVRVPPFAQKALVSR